MEFTRKSKALPWFRHGKSFRVNSGGRGDRGLNVQQHEGAEGTQVGAPADCLEVIEKSVNRQAEKLYGVEGQGPFDEF